ncbi:MAG: DeoR/GlpR transcriptional regulator [Clostridia bacterium]|nr:DeoR/GlpR transcriptional regulator [Clostridia bacterium]
MRSQRLEEISRIFAVEPFVSLRELSERFPDLSEMTLRRDIEALEEAGEVIRVRGGARSVRFISRTGVDSITKREAENVDGKRRIAERAASFLEPGRSIFLDSGSTMRQLPSFIPEEKFSFTTTDPKLAVDLLRSGTAVVNMVGGRVERDNQTVTGLQATRFLTDVNVDIACLTPAGASLENGFTVGSYNECEVKRIVAAKARRTIVLVECSKLGKSLPYTFCGIGDADVLITDAELPDEYRRRAEESGVAVVVAV